MKRRKSYKNTPWEHCSIAEMQEKAIEESYERIDSIFDSIMNDMYKYLIKYQDKLTKQEQQKLKQLLEERAKRNK